MHLMQRRYQGSQHAPYMKVPLVCRLRIAANGHIVIANGCGALDSARPLLMTIQTNYTDNNFARTGSELQEL